MGAAVLNHVEYDQLQPQVAIGSAHSPVQRIREQDMSEFLALITPFDRYHRDVDGGNTTRPRRILCQMSWKTVAFDEMCVQRVIAKDCGLFALRGNPDPREVAGLLFPCSTFEKVIKTGYPVKESRSIVFRWIERLNDDFLQIDNDLSLHVPRLFCGSAIA